MRLVLTAILVLGGLFFIFTGTGFLLDPATAGIGFGLEAVDASGLAAMRADMTAFFWLAGFAMVWGGWRRNGDVLLIPAALMLIALFGRIVSMVADGTVEGFWMPMLVESVTAVICLFGSRVLPHRDLTGS